MDQKSDDWTLLRRYAERRDQTAFALIMRRHSGLVFSAALRRVGNRELAEDVTQAVFIVLEAKSKSLANGNGAMSQWLLRCVRFASANAVKIESRRQRHESSAAQNAHRATDGACSANPTDVLIWHEIAQQLDDAVLKLPTTDRQAILLRYFEDRPIEQIAASMNLTEGAVRQRLSRATEKLRHRLARHNGAMLASIDATALAALLVLHVVRPAPAGLSAATLTAIAENTTSTGLSIAKGAMHMMTWTKAKLAAAVVMGALAITGTGGIVAMNHATASAAPTPKPIPAPEEQNSSVTLAGVPPVVVKTEPQSGAAAVDSAIKEIKVSFSKDMQDNSWSWSTLSQDSFPKTTGKPRYLADKRTCVLPVELKAGQTYAIWINSNQFGNFKDSAGHGAVPYLLVFETRK